CDKLTTKEVPSAWEVSAGRWATVGRMTADSVCLPRNLRRSAFCSHLMLRVRRFAGEPKGPESGTNFPGYSKDLTSDSSDSQRVDKFADDSPKTLGIIKE